MTTTSCRDPNHHTQETHTPCSRDLHSLASSSSGQYHLPLIFSFFSLSFLSFLSLSSLSAFSSSILAILAALLSSSSTSLIPASISLEASLSAYLAGGGRPPGRRKRPWIVADTSAGARSSSPHRGRRSAERWTEEVDDEDEDVEGDRVRLEPIVGVG